MPLRSRERHSLRSIAEPALTKVYGKCKIEYEKPLTVILEDGIWSVYETLCCQTARGGAPAKSPNALEALLP
jgi:hypothetical protein